MSELTKGDHHIPVVRMDQTMAVAAVMVGALIGTFGRPGDDPDELSKIHLVCLATFLHQLTAKVKHHNEVASILRITADEVDRNAQPSQPSK